MTVEEFVKFVPVKVIVKAGEPRMICAGLIAVRVGTGAGTMVMVKDFDVL